MSIGGETDPPERGAGGGGGGGVSVTGRPHISEAID